MSSAAAARQCLASTFASDGLSGSLAPPAATSLGCSLHWHQKLSTTTSSVRGSAAGQSHLLFDGMTLDLAYLRIVNGTQQTLNQTSVVHLLTRA